MIVEKEHFDVSSNVSYTHKSELVKNRNDYRFNSNQSSIMLKQHQSIAEISYDSLECKVPVDMAEELLFLKPDDIVYPKKGNYFSNESFRKKSPVNLKKYNKYLQKPLKTTDLRDKISSIPRCITETSTKRALPDIVGSTTKF